MKRRAQARGETSAVLAEPELDERVAARYPVIAELRRMARSVPAAAWEKLPADLSSSRDQYVYGVSPQ